MDYSDPVSLHSAAKANDLEAAQLLLKERVDIYFKDEEGLTPLDYVIQKRLDMLEGLRAKENEEFSNFALRPDQYKRLNEPNAPKDEHLTLLYKKDQKRQANFKKEKEESLSAMHQKIDENERFIDMLLKYQSPNHNCAEDSHLLNFHAACTLKNTSTAEHLSDQISHVDQSVNENSSVYPGYAALHFAALCNISMVKMLVTKGANLLIQDTKGITPLDICIRLYSIEEVHAILTLVTAWKNILFLDGKTMLMDYVFSLRSTDHHSEFLNNLGYATVLLPKDSPLWPGSTVLHVAVILSPESDLEIFRKILSNYDLVTIQDSRKSTPVHLAFRQRKLKVLDMLLKHHRKAVNPSDEDNLTHLHIAVSVNQLSVTRKLVKSEINVNVAYTGDEPLPTVKPGWTPLHTAAHTRHTNLAIELLDKGANLLQTDRKGFTAIHLVFGGSYADKILDVLFYPEQLAERAVDGLGLSHLHVATWKNRVEVMKRLLDLGSDIEASIGKLDDPQLSKFEGCRPIHMVMMEVGNFRTEAFTLLLERGADIFARKLDGSSPLSTLLTGRYDIRFVQPIVKLLWSRAELQSRVKRETGITMLHIACFSLDEEKIRELLLEQAGVDVDARTLDDSSIWPGFTPLHVLVLAGLNMEHDRGTQKSVHALCHLLLENKADVTLANAAGDTPVHMALKAQYTENGYGRASFFMKYQRDFSVNPVDRAGMSLFHVACLLNEVDIARKFLQCIAGHIDVNAPISSIDGKFAGHTPLLLALSPRPQKYCKAKIHVQMVDLLLGLGADVHAVDASGYTAIHRLAACAPTRFKLLNKIVIDRKDINKQAADGKTPLEVLLWSGGSYDEIMDFIECGARINTHNPISGVGYMAIVVSNKKSRETAEILRMMMNIPNVTAISDCGRNAIHNAVAVESFNVNVSGYQDLLDKLVKLGCDIHKQDSQGRTPLHLAVQFQNKRAVEELLKCGASVDVVDATGKSPFSYAVEVRKTKKYGPCYNTNIPVCKVLAVHLRKLQLVGWRVSEMNANLLRDIMYKREDVNVDKEENVIDLQLEKASTIKMYKRGFTIREFLHQTGAVNLYPSLKRADREEVDSFVKSTDYTDIDELQILLKLQHKYAVDRMPLIVPVVNALRILMGFPLPDLCAEMILMYLTNSDLENTIEAATMSDDTSMVVD